MTAPALTRDIGQAERAMRAVLERLLDEAGLTFPEWTVLVFLDGTVPLARSELVRRQVDGRVAHEDVAQATVDGLRSGKLLAPVDDGGEDPRLAFTAAGEAAYRPVRQTVSRITEEFFGDLPPSDLKATHRTLAEVTRRANSHLTAGS